MADIADTGCFASVHELRLEHLKLMERDEARGEQASEQEISDIRSFVARAKATGSVLSDRVERREAQGILDYWSSTLVSMGGADLRTWTQPRLVDFQEIAKRGEMAADAERTKAELARLDENARQLIRLSALARQWKTMGRYDGYLLIGDALENAKKFRDQDQDVDELIKASDEHVAMRNKTWRLSAIALIAALTGLAVALAWLAHDLSRAKDDLEAKNEVLQGQLRAVLIQSKQIEKQSREIQNQAKQNIQLTDDFARSTGRSPPANIKLRWLSDVKSFDVGSDEDRLSVALNVNRLLRGTTSSAADQQAIAQSLVNLTDKQNVTALSPQGRHYLLFILSLVPVQFWNQQEWQDVRNQLRQNLNDLQSAVEANQITLDPKSWQYLDAVKSYVGAAK